MPSLKQSSARDGATLRGSTAASGVVSNRLGRVVLATLAAALLPLSRVMAQQAEEPGAATTPAAATRTTAAAATTAVAADQAVLEVIAVEGYAEYTLVPLDKRTDGDWRVCEKGTRVGAGGAFRTGPKNSRIRYVLPPDVIECELSLVTVEEVVTIINQRNEARIETVMPRGGQKRLRAPKKTGQPKQAEIRTGDSVLGIRGTEVVLYDQAPFVPVATSFTGQAYFRDLRRQTVVFGGTGTTVVTGTQSNPAQLALGRSAINPTTPMALTATETTLVDNLVSRGAVLEYDARAGINVVRGGSAPAMSDPALAQSLPGTLNFVLRWDGPANLDVAISPSLTDGTSEFALPASGLNFTPSGLRIPFDHRGDGHSGLEVAYYSLPPLERLGVFAVVGIAHNVPAERVELSAFLNGQRYVLEQPRDLPANEVVLGFFDASNPDTNLNFKLGGLSSTAKTRSNDRLRTQQRQQPARRPAKSPSRTRTR